METLTRVRTDASSGERTDDLSSYAHRQCIGWIGLILPLLLIYIVRDRDGEQVWRELDSISAYYYSGAVSAFAGMLVALSLFLFTYQGYNNDSHWKDRACGIVAAIAALGVAYFPTATPIDALRLVWWKPWMGYIHLGSAVILFTSFAVFALFQFPQREKPKKTDQPKEASKREEDPWKKWRNLVYYVCGAVIVLCIGWAALNLNAGRPIFVPESIALIAFSVSWLVKGYAHQPIMRLLGKMLGK